jgi:hypothetical protein
MANETKAPEAEVKTETKAPEAKVETKAKPNAKGIRKVAEMLIGRKVEGERMPAGVPLADLRGYGEQIVDLADGDERLVMFGNEIANAKGTPDVFGAASQIVQELDKREGKQVA